MIKNSFLFALAALFILPGVAFSKISKKDRDLVIVAHLDLGESDTKQFWKDIYTIIEREGVNMVRAHIGRKYRKVHVLRSKLRDKKPTVTLNAVVELLDRITQQQQTKAVDMMWMTHGLEDGVIELQKESVESGEYANQTYNVQSEIALHIRLKIPGKQRKKLRIIYSTACWGASHMKGWLVAGFKAASGSRAVFTDAAVSYPRFLTSWGKGHSFRRAVDRANTTQKRDLSDKAVARMKRFAEFEIDSFRMTRGDTCMTIDHEPDKACKKRRKPSKTRMKRKRKKK